MATVMNDLPQDHRNIHELLGLLGSEKLVASGRDYVDFLSCHARLEDETVFVEAIGLLDEADWSDIAKVPEAQADPIFGPVVQHELQVLHQHIRNSAGA